MRGSGRSSSHELVRALLASGRLDVPPLGAKSRAMAGAVDATRHGKRWPGHAGGVLVAMALAVMASSALGSSTSLATDSRPACEGGIEAPPGACGAATGASFGATVPSGGSSSGARGSYGSSSG